MGNMNDVYEKWCTHSSRCISRITSTQPARITGVINSMYQKCHWFCMPYVLPIINPVQVRKVPGRTSRTDLQLFKIFPVFTILFSFWVLHVTLTILDETGQSFIVFALLLIQVYLNWLALLFGNRNCTATKTQTTRHLDYELLSCQSYDDEWSKASMMSRSFSDEKVVHETNFCDYDFISPADIEVQKIWYCSRCCREPLDCCHHCPVCKKCVIERHHHCIFLGTCISKKNILHFIILLIYSFLASSYVTLLLCNKMNLFGSSMPVLIQHFFPVSFARWISGNEYVYNMIEKLLLNITASLAVFSVVFAIYYLCRLANSEISFEQSQVQGHLKPRFFMFITKLSSIFGKDGLINLIFPTILVKYLLPFSCISNSEKEN